MRSRLTVLIAVIAFAAVTVAAGCGSSNNDNGSTTEADADGRRPSACSRTRRSPARFRPTSRTSGTLTVAADATYAPDEFIASDGKTVIGMDADLAKAIAASDGRQGRRLERQPSTASSRALPPASTTSACPRSRTPRSARRRSTSSPTRAPETSFFVKADGGPHDQLARRPLRPQRRRREGHDRRPMTRRRRARSARRPASRLSASASSPTRTAPTWRCRAGGPTSAWPTRPVADYTVKQSDGQFKLARRPRYGDRALRDRDGQGQRPAAAGARGRQGPDRRRHLQEDPRLLGTPERRDQQSDRSTGRSS